MPQQTIVIETPESEEPELNNEMLSQAMQLGQTAEQVTQLQSEVENLKATLQNQNQELELLRQQVQTQPIMIEQTQEPEPEPELQVEIIEPPMPEPEPEPEPEQVKQTPGWLDWLLT